MNLRQKLIELLTVKKVYAVKARKVLLPVGSRMTRVEVHSSYYDHSKMTLYQVTVHADKAGWEHGVKFFDFGTDFEGALADYIFLQKYVGKEVK